MKVVVFFATGYEEIEALAVVDVLRRGSIEVIMAGVDGEVVKSGRNIPIVMDQKAEQIVYNEVDMIVIPGGVPGVHNLFASELVKKQIHAFKEAGKWIGAICAGPGVLGKLGVLQGEKATCYPGVEHELIGCEIIKERVIRSGKIITGIGAGASLEFALELLKALVGEEKSHQIKEGMLVE